MQALVVASTAQTHDLYTLPLPQTKWITFFMSVVSGSTCMHFNYSKCTCSHPSAQVLGNHTEQGLNRWEKSPSFFLPQREYKTETSLVLPHHWPLGHTLGCYNVNHFASSHRKIQQSHGQPADSAKNAYAYVQSFILISWSSGQTVHQLFN